MPAQKFAKNTKPNLTPEEFLAPFPLEIQALTHDLRALIKQSIPNVIEAVYAGWKLLGYRVPIHRGSSYLGYIFPTHAQVQLGFEYGIILPDPARVLEGTGTQVRYVTFRPGVAIAREPLIALIAEAVTIASIPNVARRQQLRALAEQRALS